MVTSMIPSSKACNFIFKKYLIIKAKKKKATQLIKNRINLGFQSSIQSLSYWFGHLEVVLKRDLTCLKKKLIVVVTSATAIQQTIKFTTNLNIVFSKIVFVVVV